MEIAVVIGLLATAVILFARETLPVDIVTCLMLVALMATGILTSDEAFAGFGSEVIVLLACVFIISAALRETGTVDWLGVKLNGLATMGLGQFTAVLMTGVSGLSAFMNNTTVTALLVPPVVGVARSRKVSASLLLMPLAFASILGGTCTVIGTSTNVAVSGYMTSAQLGPIGFFELTPVGLVIVGVGTAYMLIFGRRLLPDIQDSSDLAEAYLLREYLSEIVVLPTSPMVGQTLRDSDLGLMGFRVLQIHRGTSHLTPSPERKIQVGDVILVNGKVESLVKVRAIEGIEIRADFQLSREAVKSRDHEMVELLVTPGSEFLGRPIRNLELPAIHGVTVLAVNRQGRRLREQIKDVTLATGDILLVDGPSERVETLRNRPDIAILGEVRSQAGSRLGLLVLAILLAAVGISSLGWVPLSMAMLAAALAVVLVGALPAGKVYQAIEWRLLVLIAGMTAFGTAMEKTGAANVLAGFVLDTLGALGPVGVLAGFVVLTVILTQPMSNAAAALVVLPIAIQAANQLGANPRTFAIAIALAASVSLIAPFEPSNLLVYSAGKYRFIDFVKVGGPLTLLLLTIILVLVPIWWPI